MSAFAFKRFVGDIGLREDTADKLWAGNIRTPQELASSTATRVGAIVDDNLLVNTILPVLQKYAFPITMAKDPYEKALGLLRKEAGFENSTQNSNANISSDTTAFVDPNSRVPASQTSNQSSAGITPQQATRDQPRTNEAQPSTQENNRSNRQNTGISVETNGSLHYTHHEDEDLPTIIVDGENFTISAGKPKPTVIKSTRQFGTTSNVNITGGTFVQSSILSSKPTVFKNVNSTISAATFVDTEEEKKERRKPSYKTNIVIQGNTYSTSDMHFNDDDNFWIDDMTVEPTSESVYDSHFNDTCVYTVQNLGHSRALIINNIDFSNGLSSRSGADVDSRNLENLWTKLGFTVQVHHNKRKPEIFQLIKEFATSPENRQAPMLMVYVGSHGERRGNKDFFIGTDKEQIDVANFCDMFSTSNCPMMARKPKLFFFQFCRRDKTSSDGLDANNGGIESDTNPTAEHMQVDPPVPRAQNMSDMLWSFSTAPGTKAYRDTRDGSWFVTSLCKVLMNHANKEDLVSMLTMVNNSVMLEQGVENGLNVVQMTETTSTLNKKVKFFPQRL
ncbi:unnamed protein product [Clavelina lepadiformis]|uniref:Uncharacterized protein n=1 Tax=Clavelina lepadiformis TaxID=159417 RepID=A0ABP0FZJ8_CLALP